MLTPRWLYAWALGAVGLGGASLLLPLYAVELGAEPFALGLLAASAALVGAPAAFFVGRYADRTGRRRELVLAALGAITVTLVLVPFFRTIGFVIAANAVVWLAFAAVGPVLTLIVVRDADESAWQDRIAHLNYYQGWDWAGGLVLGALCTGVGERYLSTIVVHRTFFAACAACSLGALLGVRSTLPPEETAPSPEPKRLRRALIQARRLNLQGASFPFTPGRVFGWSLRLFDLRSLLDRFSRNLVLYYGAVLLFFIGFTAFFAPLPIYLGHVGFGSGTIFWLYLVSSLGAAAFYIGAAALTKRYNDGALQAGGLLLRGAAFPSVVVVGTVAGSSVVGLVLESIVFLTVGVTWAVIAVTAATIVTRLAPEAIRGEALGTYAAVSAGAGAIGSLLGGAVAELGYLPAFAMAGVFVLLGAGLVYRLRHAIEADASVPATGTTE